MDIALCNPPFGAKTLENRKYILKNYDLGYQWVQQDGKWIKTETILDNQQIGILFIERCFKLLVEGGRMGIILPEGYLCTASYGYVREWIISKFKIIGLVELPRRIFLKSDADLRSNILFAIKENVQGANYPVHAELVRKVGYKLGKGFFPIFLRDNESGLEKRDEKNNPIIDTDFERVKNNFTAFLKMVNDTRIENWTGAYVNDIKNHSLLDMKPRRLTYRALVNINTIIKSKYKKLHEIADVITDFTDFQSIMNTDDTMYLIEGQDIRAVEGYVVLKDKEMRWQIENRKTSRGYKVNYKDIVVGLVRPERRNIGLYLNSEPNVFASPDGVALIRQKESLKNEYPIEWVFQTLRTEKCRLQFWTESGGTSYGKLSIDQIKNVLIPIPSDEEMKSIKKTVDSWSETIASATRLFNNIWETSDKVAILNSPIIGLETTEIPISDDGDDDFS